MFLSHDPKLREGPGLLRNIEAQNLAHDEGLAYHGTKRAFSVLKPSLPYWRRDGRQYVDSDHPVICAYFAPLSSVLKALARPEVPGHGYSINGDGGYTLYVPKPEREALYRAQGVVAVSRIVEFQWVAPTAPEEWPVPGIMRGPELRRDRDLEPDYNVVVGFQDMAELLAADSRSKLEFR